MQIINEATIFGRLQVFDVDKDDVQTARRYRILQYLIKRNHRKYGYDIEHQAYGHFVYEAFMDGQPFGWFFIKYTNRKRPTWAAKGWRGCAPLTKFTFNCKFNFNSLGNNPRDKRNSRDKLKALLWNALRRYLFAGRAEYLRETVAAATVQNTRHILEPFLYDGVQCVGANFLSTRELRQQMPLSQMTGNGKLTFYAIHPQQQARFNTYTEEQVKAAVRSYGWVWDPKTLVYYSPTDTDKQDPISDIVARRVKLSRVLRRT